MNPALAVINRVIGELRPMPDRVAGTLRITGAVLITALVMLTFRNSMLAIGPFLVFILMQRSTLMTTMVGVLLIPAMAITSGLLVGIEMLAWNTAWLRILLMAMLFWSGFWIMSRAPAISVLAIFPMSLISVMIFDFDQYPDPNWILSQIGWVWAAFGIALSATLFVQRISRAPSGMDVFRDDIRRLLGASEEACLRQFFGHREGFRERIAQTMARDAEEILISSERLEKAKLLSKSQAVNCRTVIAAANGILKKAGEDWEEWSPLVWKEIACRLRALRTCIRRGTPEPRLDRGSGEGLRFPLLDQAERAVGILSESGGESPREKLPPPSAEFTNVEFATRATLATMFCYFFASLTDWSGIHTCMITCVVTALSRLDAQSSKQFQRMLGATLGGMMTLVAMVWLIPATNDLTSVLLILGGGTAIAAWCTSGREKVSYVGWQMGLAFYLTILQDPHATTNLDPLRDRLVGIYLGIMAMRFFFMIRFTPCSGVSPSMADAIPSPLRGAPASQETASTPLAAYGVISPTLDSNQPAA